MLTRRTRNRRLCLAALAAVAPLQLLWVSVGTEDPVGRSQPVALSRAPAAAPRSIPPVPQSVPAGPALAASRPAPSPQVQLVTEPEVAAAPAAPAQAPEPAPAPSGPRSTFAERFPAQAAASQDLSDPATTRWALLIGINEHRGGVSDNIGSRQDAEDLRAHLLASGWRDDHILLLTDRRATGADIIAGTEWLAEKTDEHSVAVFHYSGHSKKWYGRDVDGDGEVTDEGLWPSDGAFIVDSELVGLLDPVRPHALWLSFATCNAAGLGDAGMAAPGRIVTFSSEEHQKSYEHPSWGNSVWGWLMFEQAIAAGHGDVDRDGRVTVEEAFAWARPRATETTSRQRHGSQDGVIVDQVPGDFDLLVPGAPRPSPRPSPERNPDRPTAQGAEPPPQEPQPAPDQDDPRRTEPTEEPEEDRDGTRICVLCDR